MRSRVPARSSPPPGGFEPVGTNVDVSVPPTKGVDVLYVILAIVFVIALFLLFRVRGARR